MAGSLGLQFRAFRRREVSGRSVLFEVGGTSNAAVFTATNGKKRDSLVTEIVNERVGIESGLQRTKEDGAPCAKMPCWGAGFISSCDGAAFAEVPIRSRTATTGECEALVDYCRPHGVGGVSNVRASRTQPSAATAPPSPYMIWRIHEKLPRVLELMVVSCDQSGQNLGLRLLFDHALSPCANVVLAEPLKATHLLYEVSVLTVTGVLYCITLSVARSSKGKFSMQLQSTAEQDVGEDLAGLRKVTSLTATPEFFIAGGESGSILCWALGNNAVDPQEDYPFELRDGERGFSRLWGGFRGKATSPVKCLAIQSLQGASLLFAIYEDNSLKVWDLVQRNRQFSQILSLPVALATSSSSAKSMWVQDTVAKKQGIPIALDFDAGSSPSDGQTSAAVVVYTLHVIEADGGIRLSHVTPRGTFFATGHGSVIGCRMLRDKIWVLQRGSQGQCDLFCANLDLEKEEEGYFLQKCLLQESTVGEQLFQGSGQTWDELLFALHHIGLDSCSNGEDDTVPSMFLKRLLQPGVRQLGPLRTVLQMRRRYLTDFDIGSLTLDGLRKEVKAAVKSEPSNARKALQEWILFIDSYVYAWNSDSVPYELFADNATGYVGLVRKNSVSVIRTLTSLELLLDFSSGSRPVVVGDDVKNVLPLPRDWEEKEVEVEVENGEVPGGDSLILDGMLSCMGALAEHLGPMALGVFHEALLKSSAFTLDSLVTSLLLVLDVGYAPLDLSVQESLAFGVDEIRAKMQSHHQRQRKFAFLISQSLQTLRGVAGSWEAVLDVVEKYIRYLIFSSQASLPLPTSALRSLGGQQHTGRVPLGSVPTKILSQAIRQISWTHFEASRNLLLLLSYLVKVRGQVGLAAVDVTRIQLNLLPQVQEGLAINVLLHWLTVTFAEAPPSEDCSLQLSSLQIDGSSSLGERGQPQPETLGAGEVVLAEILAAAFLETTQGQDVFRKDSLLPSPDLFHSYALRFASWLLVGDQEQQMFADSSNGSSTFSSSPSFPARAITLSSILLQHGQYSSLDSFLTTVEQLTVQQQHLSDGIASIDGEWSARLHLSGICSLARAQSVSSSSSSSSKEVHVGEAIQCFFRAAFGVGKASKVLQTVFFMPQQQQQSQLGLGGGASSSPSAAAWRLQYFEWVMQLFDQYKLSEGACRFAHAALEQVDGAVREFAVAGNSHEEADKSGKAIKGRLWANIFTFLLDLELYGNAYCAIISNPDEESKDICLRRFIIVLCDHKASQALCGNELPYGAMLNRVEDELVTKAHNSDASVKAGLFKQLYALQMHHHNVGRAAGYMYEYAMTVRDMRHSKTQASPHSLALLQEELDALAAATNALEVLGGESSQELATRCRIEWLSPIKRQRTSADRLSNGQMIHANGTLVKERKTIDVEQLVKEHALTFARVQLASVDPKNSALGPNIPTSDVALSLLHHGLYEGAFSLVFLCWKDSSQKTQLETVFEMMARKCCLLQLQSGSGNNSSIKSSEDFQLALTLVPDTPSRGLITSPAPMFNDVVKPPPHTKFQTGAAAKSAWQALKVYLEKYWKLHPSIRGVVANTILSVDRHMELPLWLINTFKTGLDSRGVLNSGSRLADPAALLRIYVDHERYVEATYMVLESLQAATRLRPGDVIKRKQACGVWFPYTLIDRLLQHLSEIRGSDEIIAQFNGLRVSLQNAVLHHFELIKKESDDVRVIAESGDFNGPWKGFS